MKKKLIDLYKDWMRVGTLPDQGLCNSIPKKYSKNIKMFQPEEDYLEKLIDKSVSKYLYWGSGSIKSDKDLKYGFTPLRQTIVLFICAMNNEIEGE